MQRYVDLFHRARKKPLRFLVWKAGDLLRRRVRKWYEANGGFDLSDRRILALMGCRTAEEAATRFLNPARQAFPVRPEDRPTLLSALAEVAPGAADETVRRAEAILRHEFDLLGSGPVVLGEDIDWHQDFKVGRKWPVKYFAEIEYTNLEEPSDVKVPWELSRSHHLLTLGRAWWMTGDQRFPQEFQRQVESWLRENPPAMGVNWACTMDVAIRAVNWIWAAMLMRDADLPVSFWVRLLKSLYQHGRFIINHLEYSDVNGNHYLADGTGLLYLGLLFRGLPEGDRWLAKGQEIVHGELFKQVLPDGVDFEMATAYHRLCTELFLSPIVWELRAGLDVPEPVLARLRLMLEYIQHYIRPDGTAPNFGDADDGRLHPLGNQKLQDHRYLLATGAVLFKDSDMKAAAGGFWEESLWLTGPAGYGQFQAMETGTAPESRAFPHGGVFVMRQGPYHLVVDCGEVGLAGRGGHGHNDLLSVEISAGGPVVIDPGSYIYTADWQWRERFRSTAFHNSVQVDGEEINRLGGKGLMWTIHPDADHKVQVWESGPDRDRFVGEHSGYRRLADPVSHSREIIFDKQRPHWLIRDTLTGASEHELTGRWHLHPDVTVHQESDGFVLAGPGRIPIVLTYSGPAGLAWSQEDGWYSPSYGVRVPTRVLTWRWRGSLPAAIEYVLTPTGHEEGKS